MITKVSTVSQLPVNAPLIKTKLKKSTTPMLVLFGSNSGSCESFAQKIVTEGSTQGYQTALGALDDYVGRLPTEGVVIIVTGKFLLKLKFLASYEGQPPDNAKQFVAWLETVKENSLSDVKYAVFGCGNQDWVKTYQSVPKLIDSKLNFAGATKLLERGEADARGDFFGDFDHWFSNLWPILSTTFGIEMKEPSTTMYSIEIIKDTRSVLLQQNGVQLGEVLVNEELVQSTQDYCKSKRHIEILLPLGMNYRSGDYLAVLPANSICNVSRALKRFGLSHDSQIVIHPSNEGITSSLPTGYPISASEVLTDYVELGQPITRKQIQVLVESTKCPPEKIQLEKFYDEDVYKKEILKKRISVLDLLEEYQSCQLSFGTFISMLPPMHARQYSISSSPLFKEDRCTLTLSVLASPAWSGKGTYFGVASNYLASATPGTKISVMVRPSNSNFHLPSDSNHPIIMVGAGSGIAPFRGFIQERAAQVFFGGKSVGKALLFFGCHSADTDYLYKEELTNWSKAGVVDVYTAFSQSKTKYVQDAIWENREQVMELLNKGARIYVCGDGKRMAPAVRDTFLRIYQEFAGVTSQDAEKWLHTLERITNRYVTDIFT